MKVIRVARINRNVFGKSRGRDQRVVRPSRRLAASNPQRRCHSAERACGIRSERNRLEVGLGLLQMRLTRDSFPWRASDVWAYGQFGQGDCADDRVRGKCGRVRELTQQDHRGGVEHPSTWSVGHKDASRTASRSRRRASGSTCGRWRRRAMRSAGVGLRRMRGRSSATSAPSRVTTRASPRATRSRTSPPWLRNSRTVTESTEPPYHW